MAGRFSIFGARLAQSRVFFVSGPECQFLDHLDWTHENTGGTRRYASLPVAGSAARRVAEQPILLVSADMFYNHDEALAFLSAFRDCNPDLPLVVASRGFDRHDFNGREGLADALVSLPVKRLTLALALDAALTGSPRRVEVARERVRSACVRGR